MVCEWIETTIGDHFEIKHGFPYKGEHFRDDGDGDILVTPGNFRIGGGFTDQTLKRYVGPEAQGYELPAGEIVVTMTDLSKAGDTLGYSAKIPADGRRYLHNQRIGRLVPRRGSQVNPDFAYWIMRTADYRHHVLGAATGSTVRHTAPSRIQSYRFCRPPLPVQQQVTKLLGALEDKIELNRRMAETLEAMARALFKSWFVDFDTVRAKAEDQVDGLPKGLADLFPSRLNHDGLPEGWAHKPLSTIGRFLNGLALQKYEAAPGVASLPVVKIAELRTGPTPKSGRATLDIPPDYVLEDGDHLFSWSGSLMHVRWAHGPGALNQHLFKVTPRGVPAWLTFQAVEQHLPVFRAIASGKAVTMGHIQRHHLDEALVAIPDQRLLQAMNTIISPLFEKTLSLALQSRTLGSLRDALLPKLISGELRVGDVEHEVAVA